ncbi:MAG: carboxypeptidase regulatory-like domain-containing protein [Vicinamibacterales bacterium]
MITRLLLFVTLLVPAAAAAQTHLASVRGRVTGPTGDPIAGASLTLTRDETGEIRTVTTGPEGDFTLVPLAPGAHRLAIRAQGYAPYERRLELTVNRAEWMAAALSITAPPVTVDVTAEAPPIDRDSPAIGTVIDANQIARLPLDGRNFLELALLAPGIAPSAQGSATSVRGDFAFSGSGGREDANAYLLDGVYNLDPKLNGVAVRPPVDGIREFEVLTSGYDASFGRNAGAQVNVITRSGANRLNGTGYLFLRNGALDARNFFAPRDEEAPEYERYQFGGSAGGPIKANRLFFFADYEGTRLNEGITRVTTVPTAAERAGDFSRSAARPTFPGTPFPFPGNQIPSAVQHPTGRAIANLYPQPNREGSAGNFVSSPAQVDEADHFDVRADHVDGGGATLTVRYSFADRRLFEPFAGPQFSAVPGYGNDVPRRAQNLAVSYTRPFAAALVNEARVAWTRVATGVFQENQGRSLNREIGLPELSSNPRDWGLSFITISGYSPIGDEYNNPQDSTTTMIQTLDTVSWAPGRHLVKAGVDFRATDQDAFRDVQSRGNISFVSPSPYTGNPLADLLLGLPLFTTGARLDNPQRLRTHSFNLFVNDSIRIAPNVTVTAGLRYDYNSPPVDEDDRATLYDPATGTLVPVGTGNMPRGGYEADRNNVGPRAGVAWTPDADGRTSVRAGYGLYFDQSALATSEGLYFNQPYFDLSIYFPLPTFPLLLNDPWPASYPLPTPDSALAIQRDFQTGKLHHFSAGVQRQLGRTRAIEAAYVGTRGRQLIAARDMNQPAPSPQPFNLRPNPFFADITLVESRAESQYDSLQLTFSQRLDRGLAFVAAYTLSESTDDASGFFASTGDPNFPQDSNNVAPERGRSNFDVRHRFSASFSYELPWALQLEGVVALQSGRPFTVALLPELDNSNTGRSVLGFGANDRPNQTGNSEVPDPGPDQWFNTAAFAMPPFGSFGNVGRNTLEGPGYSNVNLGLMREFGVGARAARLQLRLEAFNLFNRVNFNLPDNFFGSPTFGRILSAGAPRRIQIGAKLLY